MIIDYSTSRPSISRLHSAGVTAVGRYIGWDSVPGYASIGKNITRPEAETLIGAGIEVFLAFEYTPDAASHGSTQGHADGQLAGKQISDLGAPPDMAAYFAVDFNIPDYAPHLLDTPANALDKLGPVGEYFKSINALKAAFEIGAYGGYYAIKRLLDAKLITKAWQTVAWSGIHLDPRAVLYQLASPGPIFGSDIDIREHASTEVDFGQWPRPNKSTPPPTSKDNTVMGQLVDQAYLPFSVGTQKGIIFYRDFLSSDEEVVIRLAVHSASKGYWVTDIKLNTPQPLTTTFTATDVDAISLILKSGKPPVGYALV